MMLISLTCRKHLLKASLFFSCIFLDTACQNPENHQGDKAWKIAVIPASVRINPVSGEWIDTRYPTIKSLHNSSGYSLDKNWVYQNNEVRLSGARGEYISFQVVLENLSASPLKGITTDMAPFSGNGSTFSAAPEIFLEWSVEVKEPSTGYEKATLGSGWYPDALIPMACIQADSNLVSGRWTYPLWLPDFNNRIDNQKYQVFWVDQFIPAGSSVSGEFTSEFGVTIGGVRKSIPVTLKVWNFDLPNENNLRPSLQEEGFLSHLEDETKELAYYQLFKRNRITLMDPTYKPEMSMTPAGDIRLDWAKFDSRMKKYFNGQAFTRAYGYDYGPGYGEPIEHFVLPFDVHGKHNSRGWPETGSPEVEKEPFYRNRYLATVRQVREHLHSMVDPGRTALTVYLNGLDESYDPLAYKRMKEYGAFFRENYPEALYRIDGAYDKDAMKELHTFISAQASHTINYSYDEMKGYQENGLKVFLYGPMIYEGKVNSWVGSSTFTDLPLLNDRAISWTSWLYKTHSWISWGIGVNGRGGWYDSESWKDEYKSGSDSDPDYTFKKLNGSALMVYAPGIVPNVSELAPSIRLKAMRDGVQEYEYLKLLSSLDGNTGRADSLVREIIHRPFGKQAIGNIDVWNFDPRAWDNARIQLGEWIEQHYQK